MSACGGWRGQTLWLGYVWPLLALERVAEGVDVPGGACLVRMDMPGGARLWRARLRHS